MQPLFLNLDQVLQIHRNLIETYGGVEGIRDVGLLHSAIAMPQASFEGAFLHRDPFEMAAAYLYHITQNHPFLDGNKRTGAAAAIIFLAINDIELEANEDGLVELALNVAQGKAGKEDIADFFRKTARN
jgi:death on curing protein